MNNKDIITKIGSVDIEKITDPAKERIELIEKAMEVLEFNEHLLKGNEADFYFDMSVRYTHNQHITDKQVEFLVSLMNKYM